MALRLPSFSPVTWVTVEKIAQQVLWLILFWMYRRKIFLRI